MSSVRERIERSRQTRSRIERIQRRIGVDADGIVGPQTLAKLESILQIIRENDEDGASAITITEFDVRTNKNLDTLLPEVIPVFKELVTTGKTIAQEQGPAYDYRIISGTRTWDEQDALYAKGRTEPGQIVTNARGGFSNHNFGIAVDGGWFSDNGRVYLDGERPAEAARLHNELARRVKEKRLELMWGGDWTSFQDLPHWQYNNELTVTQMRQLIKEGKAIV